MSSIGLIGYGAFGKLIVHHLSAHAGFVIHDPLLPDSSTPATALSQPVVILAIPAQYLREFLTSHAHELNPDATYIDVCSVKVKPVEIMLELLPDSANIIATHPLFGPASAADSLRGRRIMTHPVRVTPESYETLLRFLRSLELEIIETTPEEHDKAMAYVQGLSHYIGRIMQQMDVPETPLATRAYLDLLDMKSVQGNDSDDLFNSILHDNQYTAEVLKDFEKARTQVATTFDV